MGQFIQNVQVRLKTSSVGLALYSFKLITGLFLGLSASLIAQTIVGYGDLVFWFVIFLTTAVFLKVSKGWSAWGVVIFNLVVFLLGLLLNLYIRIAPGV